MKNTSERIRSCIGTTLMVMMLFQCQADTGTKPVVVPEPSPWRSGLIFQPPGHQAMPHDNRIYQSQHFLVFSDSSSDDAKRCLAEIAEEGLAELMETLQYTESDLDIESGGQLIRVWGQSRVPYSTFAFPYGFIVYAWDHPAWANADSIRYRAAVKRLLKHETCHVVCFLRGVEMHGMNVPYWFFEGIAEHLSGGVFSPVASPAELAAWQDDALLLHPLDITVFEDFPSLDGFFDYYAYFHLAADFLFSEHGLNRPYSALRALLEDGGSFEQAFEEHMGISVVMFREHYYRWMADFLNQQAL